MSGTPDALVDIHTAVDADAQRGLRVFNKSRRRLQLEREAPHVSGHRVAVLHRPVALVPILQHFTHIREEIDLRLALARSIDEVVPEDRAAGARQGTLGPLRRIVTCAQSTSESSARNLICALIGAVDGDALARRDARADHFEGIKLGRGLEDGAGVFRIEDQWLDARRRGQMLGAQSTRQSR